MNELVNRMGWTLEQRARIKQIFLLLTIAAVFGIGVSIALLVMGDSGGWLLLGIAIACWTATYLTLKYTRKSQP
ncbi:hypothetical protein ACQEVM_38215 [Streptomyces sp. CA-243310]|uniref:hypothetical protein n=1 Tax=Streptomyces sp. CA-243310 TaxID=3240056 RepID=UPI003D8E2AD3